MSGRGQFILFIVNGGMLGLIAIVVQLAVFYLFGGSTGFHYALATIVVYPFLVVLNYFIQRGLIFCKKGSFFRFLTANVLIMMLMGVLSPVARYIVASFAGIYWGDMLGFLTAALVVSPISFLIVRYWVFCGIKE